jgi:short-subunit dehydrogenase
MTGTVIVIGAGPGVGTAVARRFGAAGHAVGLIARNSDRLDGLVRDLAAEGISAGSAAADAGDPGQLGAALRELTDRLGPAEVLCFSPLPDIGLIKPVRDTTPDDLRASFQLGVVGAAAAVAEVLPAMHAAGRGTLLFTTGSGGLTPSAARAASGVTTTAAAVYVQMLHDELATEGIHAAHVVIVGPIGPGARHEPDTVAEHLWQRHIRRDDALTILR